MLVLSTDITCLPDKETGIMPNRVTAPDLHADDRELDATLRPRVLKEFVGQAKIKENLSARRRDRINPNEFKGFSIVDLAVAFDLEKKRRLDEKTRLLKKEEVEAKEKRSDYTGNRYDADVDQKDFEED